LTPGTLDKYRGAPGAIVRESALADWKLFRLEWVILQVDDLSIEAWKAFQTMAVSEIDGYKIRHGIEAWKAFRTMAVSETDGYRIRHIIEP
jgi:hypothetical protein